MPFQAQARDRSRSPSASGAYEETVRLVVMREQARMAKDWTLADSLREQLVAKGVTIQDKTNSWRCSDGSAGRIPTWSEIEGGTTESFVAQQGMTQGMGTMAPPPAGDGSDGHIKQLVQMREQARAQKDFTQADAYREELKALGVDIFDKEKMWRSKMGASGVIIGYRGGAGPTDLEISTLVVQREKARQNNDYNTSDMIRNELRAVGVEIKDREKIWVASDGRQGPVPTWSAVMAGGDTPGFAQGMAATTGGMAASNSNSLRDQVVQAALAAASNPNNALKTLQMLQQVGGAPPSAMAPKPTRAAQPAQARAAPTATDPECIEAITFVSSCQAAGRAPTDAEIDWLVGLREKFRSQKAFNDADALRQEMRGTLGIELDEKTKQWSCSDGRQGVIPMWSSMSA